MSEQYAKVGFIGKGNMGGAILKGLLKDGFLQAKDVIVSGVRQEGLDEFREQLGVNVTKDNAEVVAASCVVMVCVKPQKTKEVLSPLTFSSSHLVISIVAGASFAYLQRLVAPARVVRVMPNTPMMVGEGACGLVGGPTATSEDVTYVTRMFEAVSEVTIVAEKEAAIDGVTAVSGSGPAYVFHLMEGMIAGGMKEGLSEEQARQLAIQTVIGAGVLARDNDEGPGVLRQRVTSPNGTTQAALEHMAAHNWKEVTTDALTACASRGRELAEEQLQSLP